MAALPKPLDDPIFMSMASDRRIVNLFRFSLYGFLKNQRYFEPFLLLAFRQKGLSFFQIGLLIGFRELCINILEVPTGAIADLYGRRRTMIASFLAYIISFVVFALSSELWHLFAAMGLFAVGEALRTGTHKAIIFDCLRAEGRQDERVKVYGFTRSWSKIGSAVSVVIAAVVVLGRGSYSDVFWLCIIPYALNIINFLGYPPEADGDGRHQRDKRHIGRHLWQAFTDAWRHKTQRRLLIESSAFEGVYKVAKDYLQVALKAAAISMPMLMMLEQGQRTAVLVGVVYCGLHLLSSLASRLAHRIVRWRGGEEAAAMTIWALALGLYAIMAGSLAAGVLAGGIGAFVLLDLILNVWRPLLVSRLNACSSPALAATTLSIESQTRSLVAMAAAPLLGLAVDHFGLWTVGVLGMCIALLFRVRGQRK